MTVTVTVDAKVLLYEQAADGQVIRTIHEHGVCVEFQQPVPVHAVMWDMGQTAGTLCKLAKREED